MTPPVTGASEEALKKQRYPPSPPPTPPFAQQVASTSSSQESSISDCPQPRRRRTRDPNLIIKSFISSSQSSSSDEHIPHRRRTTNPNLILKWTTGSSESDSTSTSHSVPAFIHTQEHRNHNTATQSRLSPRSLLRSHLNLHIICHPPSIPTIKHNCQPCNRSNNPSIPPRGQQVIKTSSSSSENHPLLRTNNHYNHS